MLLSLFNDFPAGRSDAHFQKFQKERVLERLKTLDARARRDGLAALDPAQEPLIALGMELDAMGRVAKSGYGVFSLSWQAEQHPEWAERVAAEADELRHDIKAAHRTPLRFLIWAGMGGSAEDKSMYNAAGLLKRGPCCYVLDSTDPAKLKFILEDIGKRHGLSTATILRSTLVVGMAMGMTSYEPVLNLERLAALYEKHRIESRANFIYMAAPGSLLDQYSRKRGHRKMDLQLDSENTTAGRHSAPLTRGSLIPLALAKADLRSWINGTVLSGQQVHTAWRLAAFIHAQGESGRDKLTLLLPKPWAGAALWTKQDFEESLGKSEHLGLKIVISEKAKLANYRSPKDPEQDRAFLAVQVKDAPKLDPRKLGLLRRAGYPVAVLTFPRRAHLSAYMQFMHYAVFGVAYLRNMNFVTQPGVELYKSIANRIHGEAQKAGGIRQTRAWQSMMSSPRKMSCGPLTLHSGRLALDLATKGMSAPQLYAAILKKLACSGAIEYGELTFFGDMRYSPQGKAVRNCLRRAAEELFGERLKMPADVCEGPAMNHSYHEMIIGHGKCFSTVIISEKQEELPAVPHSGDYHAAQFLATQLALAEHNRPAVAMTLRDLDEGSLEALDEFFHRAATWLRR